MPNSTYITLVVIYTVQGIIIIVGNAFTIFVFWTQRSRLTRTYFLLVNLAVADFVVGITELIVIGTVKFQDTGQGYAGGVLWQSRSNPSAALCFFRIRPFIFSLLSPWNEHSPSCGQSVIALQTVGFTSIASLLFGSSALFSLVYRIILPFVSSRGGICFCRE